MRRHGIGRQKQHLGARVAAGLKDALQSVQIILQALGASSAIVQPEAHRYQIRVMPQHIALQPFQPVGRGAAADPGIDDAHRHIGIQHRKDP